MSSREEFEAAYTADMQARGKPVTEVAFWRQLEGDYALPIIERAWWAWQASRQALVVELPAKISHLPHSQVADGVVLPEAEQYDEAIDDCREAIEAAGVRVKP